MENHRSNPAVGSQRPGGRTSRTRQAVLEATRELLVEQGIGGMRMDLIATRSGVHRSSIYRRWGSPAGIVADLASQITEDLEPMAGDSLEADLTVLATRLAAQLDADGATLVAALLTWRDPEVRRILDRFWQARLHEVSDVLHRHHCPADPRLVTRLVAGPLYYQALIERGSPSDENIEAAVKLAMASLG
ncbi:MULTISPECIES: TetR/AcrR family transcriptional regulator [unclassified Luteococcus]|uniref:TetR/AcrR family transcriptional regulator n=1 Tax=unclassified Luteococcus TaxID=2639923 RepID=UPI00313F24BC